MPYTEKRGFVWFGAVGGNAYPVPAIIREQDGRRSLRYKEAGSSHYEYASPYDPSSTQCIWDRFFPKESDAMAHAASQGRKPIVKYASYEEYLAVKQAKEQGAAP